MSPHQKLIATLCQLGVEELEVLTLIAERLLAGQRAYGQLRLATDQRDFAREALEEILDTQVYSACALIRDKHRADNLRDRETG